MNQVQQIVFNGKVITLVTKLSLQELLLQQGASLDMPLVCAINGQIIPRNSYAAVMLQQDDRLDVLTPVAGG